MKTTRRALIAAPAISLMLLAACGDDDSASGLDCDLGSDVSATFAEFAAADQPPSIGDLESVAVKLDRFDPPGEISEEVETVRNGVQILITELGNDDPDFEVISAAGESMSVAGQTIDDHLEENCP